MHTFKQFLTEASSTKVSTALETVLGVCFQASHVNNSKAKRQELENLIKKSKNKTQFVHAKEYWKITSPRTLKKGNYFTEEEAEKLLKFGEMVKKETAKAGGSGGEFTFQSKGKITDNWAKWSGKGTFKYDDDGVIVKVKSTRADVSKTDIVLGGKKYSVKNANGAQLMSGKKGESIATVEAATLTSGLLEKTSSEIISSFNKLEAFTTDGYYANMDNLKDLWNNKDKELDTILKLAKAMKAKLEDWENDKEALKKEGNSEKVAIEKLKNGKWNPKTWPGPGQLSDSGKPLYTKGMKKVIKAVDDAGGEETWISSNKSTMLTRHNKDFMGEVHAEFNHNADTAKAKLSSAFSGTPDFKNAFVYEAATGDQKFGNIIQRADYMLSWKPSKDGMDKFKVKVEDVQTAASPAQVIKNYASGMDLQVNWKSSASSSEDPTKDHMHYNVYQGVRISIKTAMDEAEKEQQSANEEYEHLSQQLNEGHLAEGAFWNKVKELASKFWGKIKEVWNKVVGIFKEVVGHLKEAAEHGARALSTVLGFDMEVTDSLRNQTLKVRI